MTKSENIVQSKRKPLNIIHRNTHIKFKICTTMSLGIFKYVVKEQRNSWEQSTPNS